MKGIIYHCITVGVLMCTLGTTFAQEDPITMKVLETNSTDDQFCFYVHANTPEQVNSISLLADNNPEDGDPNHTIVVECPNDDVCRTKICYDRPAFEPIETEIQCRAAISSTYSIGDGCTVVIFPRGHRTQEPIELNIIADCGFATPCDLNNLNPADITHLTLGVPRDDGGFDYIAYAGLSGNVKWFNEDRELIHSGSWTDKPHEVAYVEFSHYQSTSDPVLSGFGNTLGDTGISFRVSTYNTNFQFTLEKDSPVTLDVYNAMGKKMTTIMNNTLKARGEHEIIFDARSLTSGVYYYTIHAGSYTGTQRMNVAR